MKLLTILYVINATLLLLHEIESAYEKEWELFNLPGKISGFLLLHIPMILLVFLGLVEIEKSSAVGYVFGVIMGIAGVVPFVVHKIVVRKKDRFNLPVSNAVIYLNILSGIGLLFLSARFFI